MTSSEYTLCQSLSTHQKHEVDALLEAWQSLRARQIEHRLAQGQIYDERTSEEARAAMLTVNSNFVVKKHALYGAVHAQIVARNVHATLSDVEVVLPDVEAALTAYANTDENTANYASYA
ncbi:hypothetical protein D1007_04729 [Hordeum vulgare]|nr:hypothetical protein D1007_04729 [Hordeum vulgare]